MDINLCLLEYYLMESSVCLEKAFAFLDKAPNIKIEGLDYSNVVHNIQEALVSLDDCMFKIDAIKKGGQ